VIRSIADAALEVLTTADPRAKVKAARRAARDWRQGRLIHRFDRSMPDRPARPPRPELLSASHMPRRGKGGSERGRIATLHALAHIEFVAIDLAFDLIGRFGAGFPSAFVDDWMRVGADEAMHFSILSRRMRSLGAAYGDLPAHEGLWQAAEATADDAAARLAVVPMVLEARGLDVTPMTIRQFQRAGDPASARILERILADEVRHVGTGVRWFQFCCDATRFDAPTRWRLLVKRHFRGALKAPFNDSARGAAGLTPIFYSSLAVPEMTFQK